MFRRALDSMSHTYHLQRQPEGFWHISDGSPQKSVYPSIQISQFEASKSSVAERFSWAARRHTTRVEDATYCLLGLLGKTMPLLYGERNKAFLRLQLEIIRSSNDESVFVWQSGHKERMGLIAHSPWKFASKYNARKASAELKGAYAVPIEKDVSSGIWLRSSPRLYPRNIPQDGAVYRLDDFRFHGLFIAPTAWVWSREDLTEAGIMNVHKPEVCAKCGGVKFHRCNTCENKRSGRDLHLELLYRQFCLLACQ